MESLIVDEQVDEDGEKAWMRPLLDKQLVTFIVSF